MNQFKKRASPGTDLHQQHAGARLESSEIVGEGEKCLTVQGTTYSRKRMLYHLEEEGRSRQFLVIFSSFVVFPMEEKTAISDSTAMAINKHSIIGSNRAKRWGADGVGEEDEYSWWGLLTEKGSSCKQHSNSHKGSKQHSRTDQLTEHQEEENIC